jgi:L-serine/L-threonine ammonia-lyase
MHHSLHIKTPVQKSHHLLKTQNLNVFYKMECDQPSGSFKIRGMEELCRFHIKKGATRFVVSSGGNAGYSLAYVGQLLGVRVKVVVPKTTPEFIINKITNLGAEVEVHGHVWDESDHYAIKHAREAGAVYVSPFDDPLLWKGHSSMIDECAMQIKQPDKIIVAVGGGGLLCGVLEGMKRNGWTSTQILTAETIGAASFYESWKANKVVSLKEISSVASSLGAKTIAEKALSFAKEFDVQPFLVSDEEAVKATHQFFQECNTMVESACGAALALPYFHPELIKENERVLVVVCGGINTKISGK